MQSHLSFFHGTNVGVVPKACWLNGGNMEAPKDSFKKNLTNKEFAMFLGQKKNLAKFRQ
jgi:hypothetical protein